MVYSANWSQDSGDSYQPLAQYLHSPFGVKIFKQVGAAIITESLQTSIPIIVYPAKNPVLAPYYPVGSLTIPVGGQILSVSLRTPTQAIQGYTNLWGATLPIGVSLVGTTGDVLKISEGANNTFTAAQTASLVAANNAYALGSGVRFSRTFGQADAGILTTVASTPKTLNLVVDNTGNTGAGTGIALSSTSGYKALIVVDVIWQSVDDAVAFDVLPDLTQTFWIRS